MENISNYQNKVLDKLYPVLNKIHHFWEDYSSKEN